MFESLHQDPIKIPLLLFSGGLDSTFNLWERLQNTPVDVLYVDAGQDRLKIVAEKAARKALIELIQQSSTFQVRAELEHEDAIRFADAKGTKFAQVPAWIFAGVWHANPAVHSSVEIAYVMGDDALSFKYEIELAWNNLCIITKGVIIPLRFPQALCRKEIFLRDLPAELLEKIWVCETPSVSGEENTPTACGTCRPCGKHTYELTKHQQTLIGVESKT